MKRRTDDPFLRAVTPKVDGVTPREPTEDGQTDMFAPPSATPTPIEQLPYPAKGLDPPAAHEAAGNLIFSGRRGGTLHKIRERLMAGEATNVELARITPRYGARIYDLRKQGFDIETVSQNKATGVTVYRMRGAR